ncbi:MAG: phosphoglucosamine mutase [Pelagibacteraceae bacterium]|nr:phosphoglucosamine mutase [Pelagibacteraceae bacterium]|tara:strand:+ start:23978 stop:25333 length:1356 start_codon:yes stop_codon:yes gene_type:complete
MGKIFGTDGIRCLVNQEPLTAETCLRISKTVSYLLRKKKYSSARVVVCKDTRLSGYLYEPLITAGFISMGMNVILIGPLPTPAVPFFIKSLKADIGVMITASHNTYEYNGLKFFNSDGFKLNSQVEKKVEEIVLNKNKYSKIAKCDYKSGKALRLENAAKKYSKFLKNTLNKKIKNKKYKIVLDCANGATYNIAPKLFRELGHNIIVINNKPSGNNINQNCGATNINSLISKVLKNKADIGFAFDGDGDRLIAVDNNGYEIDGDMILAVFCKYLLKKNISKKKYHIVTTVMSNLGFEEYLTRNLKLKLKRTEVGDINVINSMRKNNCEIGGEQSGHIILSKYSNSGDGILAALKIIEIMSKTSSRSSDLFNLYKNYFQVKKNIPYKILNNNLVVKVKKLSKEKKITKKGMRSLIRFSGTEPLIRILVEGLEKNAVKDTAEILEKKIRSYFE